MKALLSILAVTLLIAPATRALANDNGVERGDITFSVDQSIPKGVEDRIETTMFESCDFRGASRISTTYFQVTPGDSQNAYDIQYQVDFPVQARSVAISVHAVLHLQGDPATAIEIQSFQAPICRKIP